MPGARRTHSLACENKKHGELATTGSPDHNRHSPRNGFNGCFELSLVTGLVCHHHRADTSAQLDASVGASGPHDFAVRVSAIRPWRPRVHRIPLPTSVTIAKRPSVEAGR